MPGCCYGTKEISKDGGVAVARTKTMHQLHFSNITRKPHVYVRNLTVCTIVAGSPPNETSTPRGWYLYGFRRSTGGIDFSLLREILSQQKNRIKATKVYRTRVKFFWVDNLWLEMLKKHGENISHFLGYHTNKCGIFNIWKIFKMDCYQTGVTLK